MASLIAHDDWLPAELARYCVEKGSIAIDGISLTVNEVSGARFGVNLIPHSLTVTTWGAKTAGQSVNLEVDLLFFDTTSTYWEVDVPDELSDLQPEPEPDDGTGKPVERAARRARAVLDAGARGGHPDAGGARADERRQLLVQPVLVWDLVVLELQIEVVRPQDVRVRARDARDSECGRTEGRLRRRAAAPRLTSSRR